LACFIQSKFLEAAVNLGDSKLTAAKFAVKSRT
jgi:hypothetical protein